MAVGEVEGEPVLVVVGVVERDGAAVQVWVEAPVQVEVAVGLAVPEHTCEGSWRVLRTHKTLPKEKAMPLGGS